MSCLLRGSPGLIRIYTRGRPALSGLSGMIRACSPWVHLGSSVDNPGLFRVGLTGALSSVIKVELTNIHLFVNYGIKCPAIDNLNELP